MKTRSQKIIARKRIRELFEQAEKAFFDKELGKKYSDRYVQLARKISMRYNIKISPELQKRFCKHCYSYLQPGHNCKIRTHEGHVVYFCQNCRKYMRFPYKKEQKEKRSTSKK